MGKTRDLFKKIRDTKGPPPEPVLQLRAEGRCLLRNPRPGGLSDPLSSSAATPTSLPAWLRWRWRDRAWLGPCSDLGLGHTLSPRWVPSRASWSLTLSACDSSLFWPCCPGCLVGAVHPRHLWLRSGRQRGSGTPGPLSVPSVHLSLPDPLFFGLPLGSRSCPHLSPGPQDPLIHLAFHRRN